MPPLTEVPGAFPEPEDEETPVKEDPDRLRQSADGDRDNLAPRPKVPQVSPLRLEGEPTKADDLGNDARQSFSDELMMMEAPTFKSQVRFKDKMTSCNSDYSVDWNVDDDLMKETVRQALIRPQYDVKNLYWDRGCCQKLARSPLFEHTTLLVITVNALWIAVDTDWNDEAFLLDAHWVFQVAEHFFCTFFTFEWAVRFLSFRRKCDGFKDYWFLFDTLLVTMMVAETWVMTIVIAASGGAGGGPLGSTGVLRLFRLLRLSRMARMLRRCPELMILIKGMVAACRSVFFTLLFLVIVMYMFAIALTQLAMDTDVGEAYFETIPASMFTLLVVGTFQDNIFDVLTEVGGASYVNAAIFLMFVVIGALMIMNMLIGVLCEVVSEVAHQEQEEMNSSFVRSKMAEVVMRIDKDGDMNIARSEFAKIMQDTEAVRALEEVGVDAYALVEMTDFLFQDEDTGENKVLSFRDFMSCIMDFRGSNKATVKTFVDLRKFVKKSLKRVGRNFHRSSRQYFDTPSMSVRSGSLPSVHAYQAGPSRSVAPDDAVETVVDLQIQLERLEAFMTAGLFELQQIHTPADSSSPSWSGKKQLLPSLPSSHRMAAPGHLAMSESDLRRHLTKASKFVVFAIDEVATVRGALPLPGANDEQQPNPQLQDLRVELLQLEEQLLTFGPEGGLETLLGKKVGQVCETSELHMWVERKVPQFNAALSALRLALERLSSTGSASSQDVFRKTEVSEEVS